MQEVISKLNINNITSYAAVGAIVTNDCNIALAAENLDTTESTLINLVCSDRGASELLAEQLRTRVLLKTYQAFNIIQGHVIENLEIFESKEVIKIFATLSSILAEYLKEPSNSIDVIMKNLPDDVKGALQNLLSEAS